MNNGLVGGSVRSDVRERVRAKRDRVGNLPTKIIRSFHQRQINPLDMDNRLKAIWLKQLEQIYKQLPDRRPFVKVVCTFGHWPTRLGHARIWANFVDLAYEAVLEQNLTEFLPKISLLMVDRSYDNGKPEDALTFAEQALAYAEQYKDLAALGVAVNYLVALYGQRGRRQEALDVLNGITARGVIGPESDLNARFMLNYAYFRAYVNLAMFEQARRYVDDLTQMQTESVDRYWRTILNHEVGLMEWYLGNFEAAEQRFSAYKDGVSRLDQINPVVALVELGNLALSRGRLSEAEQLLENAHTLAHHYNNHIYIMRTENYLSRLRWAQGRVAEAFDQNCKAIESAKQLKVGGIARMIGNQGSYRLALGDLAGAEEDLRFEYEEQTRNQITESNWRVWTASMLSTVCRLTNRMPEAIAYAQEAIQIARDKKAKSHLAIAHYTLAACIDSPQEAWQHYEHALALVKGRQQMAEAICYFGFAHLESDPKRRAAWWKKGSQLLVKMGAERWLEGRTPDNPPVLPAIG